MSADALKTFEPGEDILASDTNDNNTYILNQITTAVTRIEAEIQTNYNNLAGRMLPIGTIVLWSAAANIPSGWIAMVGQSISSEAYAGLRTLIGSSTLPDTRGRVPQGGATPLNTIEAGLPNIKGNFNGNSLYDVHGSVVPYAEGAFETGGSVKKGTPSTGADSEQYGYNFDASRSSSIYSDNVTTVQPPAWTTVFIIRYE